MSPYHQGYNHAKRQRRAFYRNIAIVSIPIALLIFTGFQPSPQIIEAERERCHDIGEADHIATVYEPDTRDCVTAQPIYLKQ